MKAGDFSVVLSALKTTPRTFVEESLLKFPDDHPIWAQLSLVIVTQQVGKERWRPYLYLAGYLASGILVGLLTAFLA